MDRLRPRQQGRAIARVYVYSLEQDKSSPITDGLSEAIEPVFDAGGKYLYFLGSTDAGPEQALVQPVERRHAGRRGGRCTCRC